MEEGQPPCTHFHFHSSSLDAALIGGGGGQREVEWSSFCPEKRIQKRSIPTWRTKAAATQQTTSDATQLIHACFPNGSFPVLDSFSLSGFTRYIITAMLSARAVRKQVLYTKTRTNKAKTSKDQHYDDQGQNDQYTGLRLGKGQNFGPARKAEKTPNPHNRKS